MHGLIEGRAFFMGLFQYCVKKETPDLPTTKRPGVAYPAIKRLLIHIRLMHHMTGMNNMRRSVR